MRVLSTVALFAFVLLLRSIVSPRQPPVEVRNETNSPVEAVRIEVAGHGVELPGLLPGESFSLPMELRQDGPLRVSVRFADGKEIHTEGGYFTPGLVGGNALTIVGPDSLRLEPLQQSTPSR